ncbi:IclR family transcriptional regulator [Weizmannia acidilactici]|uniref:IclR family transcriptional regulator n=1 Tax=Weizmannia acidilactici TaxID=2607726 RepID=A0A5J4JJ53_9BACI|nr:IclR family transcriptional regulator [Weizmannia acidilactici]GER67422.1 IclR family transcriptional regulator [Weizmannia acidilactici]GER70518.1 IclR family transcriptional regulator [Weizmannia acidilactici]GER72580.1 IclR family transcriptional regulator [Weizmannia acidilactici]
MENYKSEVPALETAIKILEYLSRYTTKERTLSQISKNLDINKSTCHRILKVLHHFRYVSYDEESKQYHLGSNLIVLGARASEFINYLRLARPYLKWVNEQTRLTSVLLEPVSDNRLMYIAKEEADLPDNPFQVTVKLGQQFPLTSASFGKCYLAFTQKEKMKKIVQKVSFKQFTDQSITDVKTFVESLNEVRKKGYAVSYGEHTRDVFGVAAPIFGPHGDVTMVIACIGFASMVSEEHISFCGEKLKEASEKITEAIGGRKPCL